MATKLLNRKRRQIKRFFENKEKIARLRKLAERRGDVKKQSVFHTIIAGKRRTVKLSPFQRLAEANLAILQGEHKKAVEKGAIKPQHYILSTVPYVYTDKRVGIMETIPGIGTHTIKIALYDSASDRPIFGGLKHIRRALEFCKRNPEITIEKIETMEKELAANLEKVSARKKHFSYDISGTNNIIVMGVDWKTGAFKIVLVDQIYPGDTKKVRHILERRKRK